MNNKISITYLILIIASLCIGCRGSVKEKNKNEASAASVFLGHVANEKYVIDRKESVVTWKASMQIGSNFHTGYVYISQGALMIDSDQVVGGMVEVNMNTIEDENHESDNNLISHLKNSDFFDVIIFPFSTIVITKVALKNGDNREVTGNLTIKGITHPVTFPAEIEVKEGIVKANGKLVIDRTDWDIRYNSGKFYDNIADRAISDSVEFDIKIVAKK